MQAVSVSALGLVFFQFTLLTRRGKVRTSRIVGLLSMLPIQINFGLLLMLGSGTSIGSFCLL